MLSFEKMRVSTRLIVAGTAVFVGLTLLAGYSLLQLKNDALAAHNQRIKDLVDTSRGVIENFQKLEADRKLTREEAQLQAKEALRPLRFGANDYFFIYDFEGRAIMVAVSLIEKKFKKSCQISSSLYCPLHARVGRWVRI